MAASAGWSSKASKHRVSNGLASQSWAATAGIFLVFLFCGYGIGYLTKGMVFAAQHEAATSRPGSRRQQFAAAAAPQHAWPGDTIHTLITSSGDAYLGYQTRIMYASYQLVQKMPGGEKLTGFTRILHRTVPDLLMIEVPTFWAFPHRTDCDGWCSYPVANRPYAIKAFFDAVALNASMIQGAWVFMLETDYVWMRPMQLPGNAWDPSVPAVQFLYDYIMPAHPDAVPSMLKLYPGPPTDIPASGPAPVLMRLSEWQTVVPDYLRLSIQMENDEAMKKALGWVREMYAWDAAVALHRDIKVRTEHPPHSTTIVQIPFDEGLGDACLCHYTWGALYHEGLASKGAKQAYRFEKRDFMDINHVLKVKKIPMPPEYKDGWILEFDAPLNRNRHDLIVLMIAQMNRAIETLPDLHLAWQEYQSKLKGYEAERDAKIAKMKAAELQAKQAV